MYRKWYEGEEGTLWGSNYPWPPGTGPKSDYYTYFNWFSLVTDFWALSCAADDAILSSEFSGLVEALTDWARYESRDGYMVARQVSGSQVYAVDPYHWAPVRDESDGDVYRGHVIGYPWYQPEDVTRDPREVSAPNRVDLHIWRPGASAEWRRYELEGNILGKLVDNGVSPVTAVAVVGDGLSEYGGLAPAVKEYAVRMSGASRVLGRHSNPHLRGPASLLIQRADGTVGVDIPSSGTYLPVADKDDALPEYVTWDADMDAHERHLQRVVDFIRDSTGIPVSKDDSGSGLVQSGTSYERSMFKAVSRVRRTRRRIGDLLGQFDISVEWQLDPFESKAERASSLTELVGAGIMTPVQAKMLLGY